MKNKYILPRGYLSWSALECFEKSPKDYAKKYFYGEPQWISPWMKLGSKIHKALETGKAIDNETKHVLDFIPHYPVREEMWECEIEGIKVKCIVDGLDGLVLGEYKTGGKDKWSQKRADEHGQITLESLIYHEKTGNFILKSNLHWIETETVDKVPRLTGRIETFETLRSYTQLEEMKERIVEAAEGITKLFKEEIAKI